MEAIAALSAAPMPTPEKGAAIARKAEEFEALVLSQLLKPMFDTAKTPSLFGGDGPEQGAFAAMLQDEYARAIAARGGVGIADQVQAALIRLQSETELNRGARS